MYSVDLDAAGERVVSGDTAGAVVVATFPGLRTQHTHVFGGAHVWATAFNPVTGVVAIAVESHPGEEVGLLDAGFVAFWDPVQDRWVPDQDPVIERLKDEHGLTEDEVVPDIAAGSQRTAPADTEGCAS